MVLIIGVEKRGLRRKRGGIQEGGCKESKEVGYG